VDIYLLLKGGKGGRFCRKLHPRHGVNLRGGYASNTSGSGQVKTRFSRRKREMRLGGKVSKVVLLVYKKGRKGERLKVLPQRNAWNDSSVDERGEEGRGKGGRYVRYLKNPTPSTFPRGRRE